MSNLYYVSMLLVVSVMCETTITQSQNESCRNINYQVSHLHQTHACCNNGSGNGNAVEDLKTQLTALQAKVQSIVEAANKTDTPCPQKYAANYSSSCYNFVLENADWMKAYVECRIDGGHLISQETIEEFNFIKNYIKTSPYLRSSSGFYTSGVDHVHEGEWVWASNGKYLSFQRWSGIEPNGATGENCLIMWQSIDWNFADLSCSRREKYICEMSK